MTYEASPQLRGDTDKGRCNVFEGYVWLIWLGVSLLLVAVEAASGDFTFLMLAGGALGGSVAAALGAPVAVQSVVAAVTAVALVFTVRVFFQAAHRTAHDFRLGGRPALGELLQQAEGHGVQRHAGSHQTWRI